VDLRGKGLTFENVQLQVKTRVAPQLPLPAPDGRVAAPLQPTARRPPRLQSVRNTRELQVQGAAARGLVTRGGRKGELRRGDATLLTLLIRAATCGAAPAKTGSS
jgi:hypothetical protein